MTRAEQRCLGDGCENPVYAKSLCRGHWDRQRRRPGDLSPLNYGGQARRHFEELLQQSEFPDSCVEWPFAKTNGYGVVKVGAKGVWVHSAMALKAHGARPDGHLACHTCDNPSCVNPKHLYWGTPTQNATDAVVRSRRKLGADAPHAKLTEEMVREIRFGAESGKELAERFGVDKARISRIRNGSAWRHIA